jgi:large subunit ribosomal protein L18
VEHQKEKWQRRTRRAFRVRKRLKGTTERPRLTIRRTLKHIYCQIIDDSQGKTLVSASTREQSLRTESNSGGNCDAATAVGKAVAERAKAAGVSALCLDRGSAKYHGRIAALADAIREAGLQL